MRDETLAFLASIFSLIVLVCAVLAYSAVRCGRWSDYGETKWGPINGCMVLYKGKWTPAESIRETP